MALLITGNAVTYVARQCNVPKQTVSRWHKESDQLLRECIQASPELRAFAATIRRTLPGLYEKKRD